jgi:hypothetical protein
MHAVKYSGGSTWQIKPSQPAKLKRYHNSGGRQLESSGMLILRFKVLFPCSWVVVSLDHPQQNVHRGGVFTQADRHYIFYKTINFLLRWRGRLKPSDQEWLMKWTVIMRSWVEDFAKKIEEKQDGDPFI